MGPKGEPDTKTKLLVNYSRLISFITTLITEIYVPRRAYSVKKSIEPEN
jgi:hypothetical protein